MSGVTSKTGFDGVGGWLRDWRERLGVRSFAQEGEDRILLRYFSGRRTGCFVDVGAHHPYRFSNTYLLYRRGWRGVNIDAMPGSMRRFRRHRPADINIEAAVGSASGVATYFIFDEPALNTFDSERAAQIVGRYRLLREVHLPVRPLQEILSTALPPGRPIDLLSVDVEGRDLDVLRSNDWARFRPQMVLAETPGLQLAQLASDPTLDFMHSQDYVVAAKTFNTTFLIDRRRQAA